LLDFKLFRQVPAIDRGHGFLPKLSHQCLLISTPLRSNHIRFDVDQ